MGDIVQLCPVCKGSGEVQVVAVLPDDCGDYMAAPWKALFPTPRPAPGCENGRVADRLAEIAEVAEKAAATGRRGVASGMAGKTQTPDGPVAISAGGQPIPAATGAGPSGENAPRRVDR